MNNMNMLLKYNKNILLKYNKNMLPKYIKNMLLKYNKNLFYTSYTLSYVHNLFSSIKAIKPLCSFSLCYFIFLKKGNKDDIGITKQNNLQLNFDSTFKCSTKDTNCSLDRFTSSCVVNLKDIAHWPSQRHLWANIFIFKYFSVNYPKFWKKWCFGFLNIGPNSNGKNTTSISSLSRCL